MSLFVTASHGTEPTLRDELRALGFRGVRADRGGVWLATEGPGLAEAMRACVWLRVGVRVLVPVAEFACESQADLYDGVRSLDLGPFLAPRGTLAVRAVGSAPGLTHTQFVAQRTKDAVVDRLREHTGERPSVDRDDPDCPLFVRLARGRAEVFVEASGAPLHERGYRDGFTGPAPIKETLAAAVVLSGGYAGAEAFVDPVCGSGTLGLEALLVAHRVAPALLGRRYAFERWPSFDDEARRSLDHLLDEARERADREGPELFLGDRAHDAVTFAREGVDRLLARLARAGVRLRPRVRYEVRDAADTLALVRGARPFVAANPPYGERLAVAADLHRALGDGLRAAHARFAVITGSRELALSLGVRWSMEREVRNGAIPAWLVAGDAG